MSRAVHPSGSQLGRVCIHYKESLSIKMLNINYVQERICFNLKINSKHCTIVSFIDHQFSLLMSVKFFLNKLSLTMESVTPNNSFLAVSIGDSNARSSKWWTDDKTTQEGFKIENVPSQFFVSQVLNKSTHISQNFNSCINLLFNKI